MNTAGFLDLEVGAATDPGRKRRGQPNQDAIQLVPPQVGRPPLFIVADGMGGHAGGEVASQLVVEAVADHYRGSPPLSDLSTLLHACLQAALQSLASHAADHPELITMGSTVVLAAIESGTVTIANIGDSRAYIIHPPLPGAAPTRSRSSWARIFSRPGAEELPNMEQVSFDHSEVAAMVRAGALTPLQAQESPIRNRLTQSLSPRRGEIDPFIARLPFTERDVLLLCTDGLWGVVAAKTIAALALDLPPQKAADQLVRQAIHAGGPDNISLIIARRQ